MKVLIPIFMLFILLSCYQSIRHNKLPERLKIETIFIDSIYKVKIYRSNDNKPAIVEYCFYDQVIKAGVQNENEISKYLISAPFSGFGLLFYNCDPCHFFSKPTIDFNSDVFKDTDRLKSFLCGPIHYKLDTLSCENVNKFEIMLILNYLNESRLRRME
jgi:hypothetical protein